MGYTLCMYCPISPQHNPAIPILYASKRRLREVKTLAHHTAGKQWRLGSLTPVSVLNHFSILPLIYWYLFRVRVTITK